ncbi:hypothetical protein AX17_006135 [Amanita inopinata Kibby_2008]|nr:hypothetical protein AX17_006135 [Amanita inopinata Kibby_2008]
MQTVIPRASIFTRFLNLRSSRMGIPSKFVDMKSMPVFQRIPPWWARWTWALIACDLFMAGSAIELTWNHWSKLVSDLEKISIKNKVTSGDASSSSTAGDHYIMRPAWQRLGLCAAHLTVGVGIAVALLVTQARFIRTVAVIPPTAPKQGRQVFIQCAHNWRNHGMTFPLSRCSLEEGRNETEMVFRVNGERGHWYIGLSDAIIYGRPAAMLDARDAILQEWKEGKRIGKWSSSTKVDDRWKSGPVLGQSR